MPGVDGKVDGTGLGMMMKGNENERVTWGKRRTAGREAGGGDELMNNHHMVP